MWAPMGLGGDSGLDEASREQDDLNAALGLLLEEELANVIEEGQIGDDVLGRWPGDEADALGEHEPAALVAEERVDAPPVMAGSSGDAVPQSAAAQLVADPGRPAGPPPPAAPGMESQPARIGGLRALGMHSVHFEGGSVTYYAASAHSKARFQATCGNPSHGKCRLTRSAEAHAKEGVRQAHGRPLGMLAAWLALANIAGFESKADHEVAVAFLDFDTRMAARMDLARQPNGPELLATERPCREGESDEPEELP